MPKLFLLVVVAFGFLAFGFVVLAWFGFVAVVVGFGRGFILTVPLVLILTVSFILPMASIITAGFVVTAAFIVVVDFVVTMAVALTGPGCHFGFPGVTVTVTVPFARLVSGNDFRFTRLDGDDPGRGASTTFGLHDDHGIGAHRFGFDDNDRWLRVNGFRLHNHHWGRGPGPLDNDNGRDGIYRFRPHHDNGGPALRRSWVHDHHGPRHFRSDDDHGRRGRTGAVHNDNGWRHGRMMDHVASMARDDNAASANG